MNLPTYYQIPSCEPVYEELEGGSRKMYRGTIYVTKNYNRSLPVVVRLVGGPAAIPNYTDYDEIRMANPDFNLVFPILRGSEFDYDAFDLSIDHMSDDSGSYVKFDSMNTNTAACDTLYMLREFEKREMSLEQEMILSGGSYGTYLAQRILAFDDSLFSRAILNGVVAPNNTMNSSVNAAAFDEAVDNIFQSCRNDAKCSELVPYSIKTHWSIRESIERSPNECVRLFKNPENAYRMLRKILQNRLDLVLFDSLFRCQSVEKFRLFLEDKNLTEWLGAEFDSNHDPKKFIREHAYAIYGMNDFDLKPIGRFGNVYYEKYYKEQDKPWYNGTKPVFILQGELDFSTPVSWARLVHQMTKNSSLTIFSALGHDMPLLNPCMKLAFHDIVFDGKVRERVCYKEPKSWDFLKALPDPPRKNRVSDLNTSMTGRKFVDLTLLFAALLSVFML